MIHAKWIYLIMLKNAQEISKSQTLEILKRRDSVVWQSKDTIGHPAFKKGILKIDIIVA